MFCQYSNYGPQQCAFFHQVTKVTNFFNAINHKIAAKISLPGRSVNFFWEQTPIAACSCDVLIEKLEKFTIKNVSLNAAIEENAAVEEECRSRRGRFYCGPFLLRQPHQLPHQ